MQPHRLLALTVAFVVLLACDARAARRVALVIGNGSYQQVPGLANPVNDSAGVAAAFRRMQFDHVTHADNLGYEAMRRALADFSRVANAADIAVVYFAGHGIEVDGQNYLIPVDARLANAAVVDIEAIPLATVTAVIASARKLRLVILDSCRNNPFRSRMIAGTPGRKRSIGRGLAIVEPGENELVAFAAAGGTEADDGAGSHSPFAAALLKNMETPGLEVRLLFGAVRDDVLEATQRRQTPHLYGTLGREQIYLVPPAASASQDADKSLEAEVARRLEAERRKLEAEWARREAERRHATVAALPPSAPPPPAAGSAASLAGAGVALKPAKPKDAKPPAGCIPVGRSLTRPVPVEIGSQICAENGTARATVHNIASYYIVYSVAGGARVTCRKMELCSFNWDGAPLFNIDIVQGPGSDGRRAVLINA